MEKTTTELTNLYINEHPHIKWCLKNGLLNYSSLSRRIAKELDIEKRTSKDAILIAARRFREKLQKDVSVENKVRQLLADSEVEIRNKIIVMIITKNIDFDGLGQVHRQVKKEGGMFFILEGSDNYTVISQEKYASLIRSSVKHNILKETMNLALVMIKSQKYIENTVGVISFITSLFAENDVNIVELISCWTDTLIIINHADVNKALAFLRF